MNTFDTINDALKAHADEYRADLYIKLGQIVEDMEDPMGIGYIGAALMHLHKVRPQSKWSGGATAIRNLIEAREAMEIDAIISDYQRLGNREMNAWVQAYRAAKAEFENMKKEA
ncbi:hypothetical protein RPALISO_185 [Ruegeria phage RpAliso]|nr:hypothetical protein RPALISO_185 [Ruegeria phage RpAliso]